MYSLDRLKRVSCADNFECGKRSVIFATTSLPLFPQDPTSTVPTRICGDTTSSYSVIFLREKILQVARHGATDAMLHPKANYAETLISHGGVLPLYEVFEDETFDPG